MAGFFRAIHWNSPALLRGPGIHRAGGQEGRTGAKRTGFSLWPHYWDLTLGKRRGGSAQISSDSGTSEAVKANTPPSSTLQLLVPPSTLAKLTCILSATGRATPREGAKSGSTNFCGVLDVRNRGMGDLAVSFYRALSRLPRPSISIGASHARGKSMMVCGTLFSSQICLKVAAMPSAFPIPATTHWRAGGLPPARPAIWTGTAPRRYRAPDSPTPTHSPPIRPSPLPRKDLYTPTTICCHQNQRKGHGTQTSARASVLVDSES